LKDFDFRPLHAVARHLGEIKYHVQIAQTYASIWLHLHHPAELATFMRSSFILDIFCYTVVCRFVKLPHLKDSK